MEKFWSTVCIFLPTGIQTITARDGFNSLLPNIFYAQLNYLGQTLSVPNDPMINSNHQGSLIPNPSYPNSDISMDEAWNVETGWDSIKVGIIDEAMYWANEDFSLDGSGTFAGSTIKGGKDYTHGGVDISNVTAPHFSHGTSVGGIVGALRNNGVGIAGVAGGDMAQNKPGVSLYSLGILDYNVMDSMSYSHDAILEGFSNTTTGYGYGLNILNNSWKTNYPDSLLKILVRECFINGCLFVAARGNWGTSEAQYPSCFKDEMVISVGASGTDGMHKTQIGYVNGDGYGSSYGLDMDVIAPGTTQLITTTIEPSLPYNWPTYVGCQITQPSNYDCFNGTSSAAPHVTGLAALMLSHHNVLRNYPCNLSQEDVEFLLQRYSTDIDSVSTFFNYPAGYDSLNGWGRINAGNTMDTISGPHNSIFHSGNPTGSSWTVVSSIPLTITQPIWGLPAGNYTADRYKFVYNYSNTFSPTTTILEAWPRFQKTGGTSDSTTNMMERWYDFNYTISGNTFSATNTTYYWFITSGPTGTINHYYPESPSHLQTAYSLHLFDPNGNVGIKKSTETSLKVNIFPNPSNDAITITVSEYTAGFRLEIYDILSRKISSIDLKEKNQKSIRLDISAYKPGMYFCNIYSDDKVLHATKKFIKQ